MYFGGFLMPRSDKWPLGMAIRAVVMGCGAMVAGWVIHTQAWPKVTEQVTAAAREAGASAPSMTMSVGPWLPVFGLPAVLLGVAAIAYRPARRPLAIAGMIASWGATVGLVVALVMAIAPLYEQAGRSAGMP